MSNISLLNYAHLDEAKLFHGEVVGLRDVITLIHERAAYEAKNHGLSLNSWIKQGIQHLLAHPPEDKPPSGKHI